MRRSTVLSALAGHDAVLALLTAGGLSRTEAQAKAQWFDRCVHALRRLGVAEDAPACAFFVPGRIEVLGKHTDYAGGRSLLAAVERGFAVVAAPGNSPAVRIVDACSDDAVEFELGPDLVPRAGHWSNYPMTVARRIARNFPGALRGCSVAFASDLPPAAGLSSSSAMIVAFFLVFDAANGLREREALRREIDGPESLGSYLGTVENGQSFGSLAGDRGVGTFGGSEDHTAILCCRPDTVSRYAFCPVRLEGTVPMPEGCVFAVANSGVVAEKTGAAQEKYNRAARLAAVAVDAWRRTTGRDDPHLAAAIASSPAAPEQISMALHEATSAEFSSRELLTRFQHFYAENEQIIPRASAALATGNVERFSRLVGLSQGYAETLLGNQVPETVFLCRCARAVGALTASAFGAGFGGSVWALVRQERAAEALANWASHYRQAFPETADRATFFVSRAGPAAFELTDKQEEPPT